MQTGAGTHLPSCNTSVGLQTGAGTHLPSCNTFVGLQAIGATNGAMGGLGGLIAGGPGGVVVVVAGLDGRGGGDVVPSELTPGLLGGGLPPLGEGLSFKHVSANYFVATVFPLQEFTIQEMS